MGRLIQIVDDDEVKVWQAVHPETREQFDTVLQLRIVPLSVQRAIQKKYTKIEYPRGQRTEIADQAKIIAEYLDHAIVGWEGVNGKDGALACTAETKQLLPEWMKVEVIAMCVGRELGTKLQEQTADGEAGRDPLR